MQYRTLTHLTGAFRIMGARLSCALLVAWGVAGPGWGGVLIHEIHYHPDVKTERVEFVEIHNPDESSVALTGWSFDRGIRYTFPAGAELSPGGYLVISQDPAALLAKYGVDSLGPFEGRLDNEGESLRLVDAAGETVDTVTYQGGFPWPVVGDPPGHSIELVHPDMDNDLGGNWRPSQSDSSGGTTTLLDPGETVRFRKGLAEASTPRDAWRFTEFEDGDWDTGPLPMGYGENWLQTVLGDMRGNYVSFFVRSEFQVHDPASIHALSLETIIDDGFSAWINGTAVQVYNLPTQDPTYDRTASSAIEDLDWKTFVLPSPATYLVPGTNVLCVQVHNASLSGSSDAFLDLRLTVDDSGGSGPSPGRRNNAYRDNLPPRLRQVDHEPREPRSGEAVRIQVKATDEDGVAAVSLAVQFVEPGEYLNLDDPDYATRWTTLAMNDAGVDGDVRAGDATYTVTLPAGDQQHRRLVRYRIQARDHAGHELSIPYPEDPVPNFAYFVYDGVPEWQGAVRPGAPSPDGDSFTFDTPVTRRLPSYHLLSKRADVEDATWWDRYGGENYPWRGTLVYDGEVYDHIRYRARGGVWRYAMVKNMWKFDFNRSHSFRARDDYGKRYPVGWDKLNLSAVIQQRDFWRRGEQGLFEAVGFQLFNLCGVEAPDTHFLQMRIIDDADEHGTDQYDGDYWGMYLAVEQLDGRFLDAHDLPDGNLYKMEGGSGELNNQGPTAVSDKSDLNSFQSTYLGGGASESWWRENFSLPSYYSYRSIVEAIHHYDIAAGKNYFFYLNPTSGQWQTVPWDLDLTWASHMYGSGAEPFRDRVLGRDVFEKEYQNRLREIRDLLYNEDQAYALIDAVAGRIADPSGGLSPVDQDRMRWDYNPIMGNSSYSSSSTKAQMGWYYQGDKGSQSPPTPDFAGMVQQMKEYVSNRMRYIDGQLIRVSYFPDQPEITYTGPAGYPVNDLSFDTTPFQDATSEFAAMAWRIGEVTDAQAPAYDPDRRPVFEITPVWESGDQTTPNATIQVPPDVLDVGRAYRVRVRYKNTLGWWGHWSEPLSFVAGPAANLSALRQHLVLSELMYHAPAGNPLDFLELHHTGLHLDLDLGGVSVEGGIDFTFPAGSRLGPGEYLVVARQPDAAFLAAYGIRADQVVGPYEGDLSNGGERVQLLPPGGGDPLIDFTYGDGWGWPQAADGVGHSLVPRIASDQGGRQLDYGGNWRASTYLEGSPGAADPEPLPGVVINEFAAHTDIDDPAYPDHDSNDWIELYAHAGMSVSLAGYYLSDDPLNLAKWAVPDGTMAPDSWISFDEVTGFHNPIHVGFGLNKAGETLFLSQLPEAGPGRVADVIRFKGQPSTATQGRYPDGGPDWFSMPPTRDAPNRLGGPPAVIIQEVLFHPPDDNDGLEYVEVVNTQAHPVPLWNESGSWRLTGGVSFTIDPGTSVGPGESLLLVSFDPTDVAASNALVSAFGLVPGAVAMQGPWSGSLSDRGERIALELPQAPDAPDTVVSWIVVDEVIYSAQWPWPEGEGGAGESIHRNLAGDPGNNPDSWHRFAASPGLAAPQVSLRASQPSGQAVRIAWDGARGVGYVIETSRDPRVDSWVPVGLVAQEGPSLFDDPESLWLPGRFYRIRIVK